MRTRGQTLLLLLVAITAVGISFMVMAQRLSSGIAARGPSNVRTQALWLGRSALTAGITGTREVKTPVGKATVDVTKQVATVRLAGSVAVVSASEERFTAAP